MITDDTPTDQRPELTGRSIVTFTEESTPAEREQALRSIAGVDEIATSSDYGEQSVGPEQIETADATIFERLGIAVVDIAATQQESLETTAAQSDVIVAVEPEHVVHALAVVASPAVETHLSDNRRATWGVQATRALISAFDGTGIRVAVLDTGFDLMHPDFTGRPITHRSFIPGQGVQDGHGHGTHCVGTACGPKEPSTGRRYGVAFGAEIHVGKVLGNEGSGVDSGILAGIEWALANGCAVISMSLGADIRNRVAAYEAVGRRALAAGSLIIAAAGNNARRPGNPGFVGSPANSLSIMAVGAVASDLRIAAFSARSTGMDGGAVDIAGPGVDVYSSWPMPDRYLSISGTSMATPHVAGVAALIAQATGKRGRELWNALAAGAEHLALPAVDVGAGLAAAP